MADPKTVDVFIELLAPTKGKGSPPGFKVYGGSIQDGDELVFENNGHPGFWVNFNLLDPHGTGLVFPHDEKAALTSAKLDDNSDRCPTSGVWGQFKPHHVTNGNRTLVVRNLNAFKARFGYALWVTDNPNDTSDMKALDPIADNRNGMSYSASLTLGTASLIGLAVGVASALATVLLAARLGYLG